MEAFTTFFVIILSPDVPGITTPALNYLFCERTRERGRAMKKGEKKTGAQSYTRRDNLHTIRAYTSPLSAGIYKIPREGDGAGYVWGLTYMLQAQLDCTRQEVVPKLRKQEIPCGMRAILWRVALHTCSGALGVNSADFLALFFSALFVHLRLRAPQYAARGVAAALRISLHVLWVPKDACFPYYFFFVSSLLFCFNERTQ